MKKHSKDDIEHIVKSSFSKIDVIRKIGGTNGGGWYRYVSKLIGRYNIDTSHFCGSTAFLLKPHRVKRTDLSDMLIENNFKHTGSDIRKRLVADGIIENKCVKCGCDGNWMGEKITLQLDHINGVHTDCRLDNLRILCPNCHAATPTHSMAKGYKKRDCKDYKTRTCQCGKAIDKSSKSCVDCFRKRKELSINTFQEKQVAPRKSKIGISDDEFKAKLDELNWNMSAVAKFYGVSDKAIAKRCKVRGLVRPADLDKYHP